MFICINLLQIQVFRQPKLAVIISNELKKYHQSSVIGHWRSATNLVIYHQSLENQVTDFNLKN